MLLLPPDSARAAASLGPADYHLWAVTVVIALLGAGALYGVFRHLNPGFGPMNLRAVGLVLVATLAALLGTLGADTRSAAIGLIGAVAGYLFGKEAGADKPGKKGSSGSGEEAPRPRPRAAGQAPPAAAPPAETDT